MSISKLSALHYYLTLVLCLLFIDPALAANPHPHTDAAHKEYHRDLRDTYDMQFINPALCGNHTLGECQEREEGMKRNARNLRNLVESTGYIRILVLLIQFTDHAERIMPPMEAYDDLINGQELSDVIPTGSMSQFILDNSYGKLRVEAEVVNWTVTDNTETYYSFQRSGLTEDLRFAYYPALDKLEKEGFDFSRFDQDGDGKIDTILMLHSGFAAEVGGTDCYTGVPYQARIWAHAMGGVTDNWVSPSTGIQAGAYAVSTAIRGHCHSRPARIGVTTHEWLHLLGLPDLIDGSGEWIGRGLGEFDIMANAHARNGAQIYPAHMSPWTKMELGWVEPIEITEDGLYKIGASELSDQIYIIRHGFPRDEYLLIENRQPILWDQLLWNGGILVYHIDQSQFLMRNRGWPGQGDWPRNGKHYQIAVLAADGIYDLETGRNSGDDEDYWKAGENRRTALGPGLVENFATDAGTYPNTNSYKWGQIVQTGITLSDFSENGPVMTFRVSGLSPGSPTTTSAPTTAQPTTAKPTFPPTIAPIVPVTSVPTTRMLTMKPSEQKSSSPSTSPSLVPSSQHSNIPSIHLSTYPSLSGSPSRTPSNQHSNSPSLYVSTYPTLSVIPSSSPSNSRAPSISRIPTTSTVPSSSPTFIHSSKPSLSFTPTQSNSPSEHLSAPPSVSPSMSQFPSVSPSISEEPSQSPSSHPSQSPQPSAIPSGPPSKSSTPSLSKSPSSAPSVRPSSSPSLSKSPSLTPSYSSLPTTMPSNGPSLSKWPSFSPSRFSFPTTTPSLNPSSSHVPSESITPMATQPSSFPPQSASPTNMPSDTYSVSPTNVPADAHSVSPSISSTNTPTFTKWSISIPSSSLSIPKSTRRPTLFSARVDEGGLDRCDVTPNPRDPCDDHKTCSFFVREGYDKRERCVWLAARPELQEFLCREGEDARTICPETCGVCVDECEDNLQAKFVIDDNERDCFWLSLRPDRQDEFCRTTHPASWQCPETCDLCV